MRGRPRHVSYTRGDIENYAQQLHTAIASQDEKAFEDILARAEQAYDFLFLKAIINFNFMDGPNHKYTAMQAATVQATQDQDTYYLSRLIQLGGEITWDTSTYTYNIRAVGYPILHPNDQEPQELEPALDYVYRGDALTGDSVYASFIRANLASHLFQAQDNILDSLLILPRDIISIIKQYQTLAFQMIFSLDNPSTWLSDFKNKELCYAYRHEYNQRNPDAEKNGYGPGALVVYQPKL